MPVKPNTPEHPPSAASDIHTLVSHLMELTDVFDARYESAALNNKLPLEIFDSFVSIYDHLGGLLSYELMGISFIENKGNTLKLHWVKSPEGTPGLRAGFEATFPNSLLHRYAQKSRTKVLRDLSTVQDEVAQSPLLQAMQKAGLGSALLHFLYRDSRPIGLLFLGSSKKQSFSKRALNIMELVGELIEERERTNHQKALLEELNATKSRFWGMAAHDLRGPAGQIRWIMDILMKESGKYTPEELKELCAIAQRQSDHILNLMNDMLDINKIQAGEINLQFEIFDLEPFLQEAAQQHKHIAASKNIAVRYRAQEESKKVHGDRARLKQVIDNLLSNAIKFSPENTTISLDVENLGEKWKVSVKDEGPGISADEKPSLFREFSRLTNKPTGGEKSTGLGLAISKRIITAHEQEIGVDSEKGSGSTFWFTVAKNSPKSLEE